MVRSLILALASVALLSGPLLSGTATAGNAFLTEFEDLPLPAGMVEKPGGTLFEAPAGRIVETQAEGNLSAQQVQSFYAETLPQLGWEKTGEATFRRDREQLHITIDDRKRPLAVHFSVVPQ